MEVKTLPHKLVRVSALSLSFNIYDKDPPQPVSEAPDLVETEVKCLIIRNTHFSNSCQC